VLYILNYAFLTHRGGFSPQARPLTAVIYIFYFLLAIFFHETGNGFLKKSLGLFLVLAALIGAYQLSHPETIYQPTTHDFPYRPGLFFQQASNLKIEIPPLLPSFSKINNDDYLPNYIWIAIFVLVSLFGIIKAGGAGSSLKPAIVLLALCWLALLVVFPSPELYNPVMITRSGSIPHAILGVNSWPTQQPERPFYFKGSERRRFVIASRRESALFIVDIESDSAEHPASGFQVRNFDRAYPPLSYGPFQKQRFFLTGVRGRRKKDLHIYQFEIRRFAGPVLSSPVRLQIYPVKE
jgi:hypothetical protein